MDSFKVTLLGTGTSHGVPVIACRCSVCLSKDRRNRRTRTSVWIRNSKFSILIDTPPDHREQALRHGMDRLDAVLVTHAHSDHVAGMDDLRAFSQKQKKVIPVYGNAPALKDLKQRFSYVFNQSPEGGGKPKLKLISASKPFKVAGLRIVPIPLWHGSLKTMGWRVGNFAYLTDTNCIVPSSYRLLRGLETLVIDGLRPQPHSTHFCFAEAIAESRRIAAKRSFLTHITHLSDHVKTEKNFPAGVALAYDGQTFQIRNRT